MEASTSSSTLNESPASKRRRLHSIGTAARVEGWDDAGLSGTLASGSTLAGSPSRKGKERQQDDETEEEEMVVKDDLDDSDDEGPLDDGDGLMADLSEEAKERLAMRDADGYLPGAVVRVQVKNFLTYDFAEFFPGPYLNMIIGPNGSGKSTIVCAIAIGLGWSPKVLGRADDLSQFLKYGATSAHVEIELKGLGGQANTTVKRMIGKDSNKSKMELNGKADTLKNCRTAIEALNIQVGNLCSFLPQDKVSEFACMTPQELLQKTQEAAGPPQMTEWHKILIEAGGKAKELDDKLQRKREEVTSKERTAQRLEGEVRNAKDREKLVQEINYLDLLIPFASYAKARELYNDLRIQRKDAHDEMKHCAADIQPHETLRDAFREAGQDVQSKLKNAQASMTKIEANIKNTKRNLDTCVDNLDDCMSHLAQHRQRSEDRKFKLQNARAEAVKAQEKFDNRSEPEALGDLEQVAGRARQALRNIDDQVSQLNHQRQPVDHQIQERGGRIKQLQTNIEQLSQVSHVRMQNLANWPKSQDVYALTQFIQHDAQNVANGKESYFKMKVYEPPCLSVDVPDKKYAHAIESTMNQTQLRTVICQCQEDYAKLGAFADNANNPIGRQLSQLNIALVEPNTPQQPVPVDREELRRLGFEGFAIDMVQAAPAVMSFLEVHAGLHRTAVSLNPMGTGGLNWERINNSALTYYVCGDTTFQTSTSRYGARTKSSQTGVVKQAKSFLSSVDTAQIDTLNGQIATLHKEIKQLQESLRQIEAQRAVLEQGKHEHEAAFNDAGQEIKRIRDHQKRNALLEQNLKEARQKYERLRNAPSEEERREQLQGELKRHVKEKIKQDLKYAQACLQLSKITQAITDYNLQVLQTTANLSAIEEVMEAGAQALTEATEHFEAVSAQFQKQKDKTSKALNAARSKLDELDQEARDEFEARKDEEGVLDLDVLEETRAEKEAERDAIGGADPAVIAKYERVQSEIKLLTEEVQDLELEERKTEKKIKNTRDRWQPELQKLINNFNKRFSAAMDSLDNRGEVRIREHEDYAQWAIEIMVSFRAEDKLHLLTATHQSGGERSLSTIMYLMSMIELSNAPFSLVDEINQGMDPRAERAVHNQMVKVTCHKEAGQFFLLTPKLLQQLDYHERMRVLVVCNGEWLPERKKNDTQGRLFLRKVLDDYKRKANAISV